ncbi:hypothetical protein [Flavobacteriaceae bacterium 14752]|uniref:hypothetical protein n=1 Tax=Mesohalobacter salilacus TaxID=2491711 RepID=UPI000F63601E|nr:hypothetical protein EIG84_05910 [Flavobacteriaceae bacterium 14752]
MKTKLIDLSNLWFAVAFTTVFLFIRNILEWNETSAFVIPLIIAMIVEVFLYYSAFTKRLSGMALFVRLVTSLTPSLILFFTT